MPTARAPSPSSARVRSAATLLARRPPPSRRATRSADPPLVAAQLADPTAAAPHARGGQAAQREPRRGHPRGRGVLFLARPTPPPRSSRALSTSGLAPLLASPGVKAALALPSEAERRDGLAELPQLILDDLTLSEALAALRHLLCAADAQPTLDRRVAPAVLAALDGPRGRLRGRGTLPTPRRSRGGARPRAPQQAVVPSLARLLG